MEGKTTNEERIDWYIKILKNIERTEKRTNLNETQRETLRVRKAKVRTYLAELCISDEELHKLINQTS
jgi:hypothetical protein